MEYPWGSGVITPMMLRILGCKFHTTSLTSDAQAGRHVFLFTKYSEAVNGETACSQPEQKRMWDVGSGLWEEGYAKICTLLYQNTRRKSRRIRTMPLGTDDSFCLVYRTDCNVVSKNGAAIVLKLTDRCSNCCTCYDRRTI